MIELTAKNVATIREMLAAASQGAQYGICEIRRAEYPDHVREMLAAGDSDDVWVVITEGADGESHCVATTGNGPHSEANARLLANAIPIIESLLAEVTLRAVQEEQEPGPSRILSIAASTVRGSLDAEADVDSVLGRIGAELHDMWLRGHEAGVAAARAADAADKPALRALEEGLPAKVDAAVSRLLSGCTCSAMLAAGRHFRACPVRAGRNVPALFVARFEARAPFSGASTMTLAPTGEEGFALLAEIGSRNVEVLCGLAPESIGQDGEPVRPVTEAEYAAHCEQHEPPPLGCERHHGPGERCGVDCASGEAVAHG